MISLFAVTARVGSDNVLAIVLCQYYKLSNLIHEVIITMIETKYYALEKMFACMRESSL